MTTRRTALSLLAAAAALALGACGSTEGGIPQSDADTLREELGDVANFVERGDCDGVDGQVRQVRAAVAELPNSVDTELRQNLNDGVGVLEGVVETDCREQDEEDEPEPDPDPDPEPEEPEPEPQPQPDEPEPKPESQPRPQPRPQPDGNDLPSDELPPPEEGIPQGEFGP
jgi:hypothetical protein